MLKHQINTLDQMKLIIFLGIQSKAKTELKWNNDTSFDELVNMMVESDLEKAKREKVLIENGLLKPTWN